MRYVCTMDELLNELRAQRDVLLRHFEALDTKGGLLLAFAGVIAALAPSTGVLTSIGRALAILAALTSLTALAPRKFPMLHPRRLSATYQEAQPDGFSPALVGLLQGALQGADRVLRSKAVALRVSFLSIFTATSLIGVGIIVHGGVM